MCAVYRELPFCVAPVSVRDSQNTSRVPPTLCRKRVLKDTDVSLVRSHHGN